MRFPAFIIGAYVAAALVMSAFFLGRRDPVTGFTANIRFGEAYSANRLPELNGLPVAVAKDGGYDGQFYAQMALRPSLKGEDIARAVDNPDYRFRRILPSWMACAGGMGDTWRVLNVYAALNMVFWILTAALLLHWMPPTSLTNFARWSAGMFSIGVVESLRLSCLDLPAAFFILLAVYWLEKDRNLASAGALAAAVMTKELSAIAAIMRVDALKPARGNIMKWATFAAIAILPFALWMMYLARLGYGFSGGSPDNFGMPLVSYYREIREAFGYLAQGRLFNFYALTGLTIQIVVIVSLRDYKSAVWRAAVSFCVAAMFFGGEIWQTDPGAAYRVLVFLPFAFNILWKADSRKLYWTVFAAGNLGAIVSFCQLARWG